MASNIRVVLEVDNKKYIADVKAAEKATDNFATAAGRSSGKLNSSLDVLGKQFTRIRTAIAGIAVGALGRNLIQLADEIQDLSNSTGLATGRIIELRDAIGQAGGTPTDAATALTKFSQAVDAAAEGSISAQNKFINLGISLDKLRMLSDEELFMTTLKELSEMEAGAKRTALMVEYFGKSFRTVDPSALYDELKRTRGEGDQYAASVKSAAELNDKLEKSFSKLRMALLQGFAPAIQGFSDLVDRIVNSREEIDKLITTVKIAGTIIAGLFAVGGALIFIRYIGVIGRGIGAAFTLLQKWGPAIATAGGQAGKLGSAISGVFRVSGPLLTALRGIVVVLATIVTGTIAASQVFDDFGGIAVNATARVVEALALLSAEMLNLPTDALAAFLNLLPGVEIKNAVGLGTPFKIAAENARAAREEVENLQKSMRARQNFAQQDPRRLDRPGGSQVPEIANATVETGPARDVDTTARSNAIKQIQQIGEELQKNLQKRREQIAIDRQVIGLSEDEAEALKTANEVRQQVADTLDSLKQKRATLSKEEQYLIPIINQQIAALEQRTEVEVSSIVAAIRGKQEKAAQERIEIQNLKQLVDLENLRASVLGYSLTEQEKFNQALKSNEFKNKTQSEIDQLRQQAVERDKLTGSLTAEKIARETASNLLELETQLLGTQFNAVQKLEQLKLANPDAFARKTQDEILALENQAKKIDEVTANFKSMAFARDLINQGQDYVQNIQDEMKIQLAVGEAARRRIQIEIDGRNELKNKIREINQSYGDEANLSESLRQQRAKEIADATAGIQRLQEVKAQAVAADQAQRDSFAFGWESAFAKYASDAQSAAGEATTYFETFSKGFEDAFVKFVQTGKLSFKDLANSIIADFARIQAKKALVGLFGGSGGSGGGGLLGSLGSFFGGFFADGGNPPMGKMSIVGERGPEAFIPRNAGTIVPLEGIGGGNQTSVTYNINAVDAASFKQMLAQDPKFLHAVVEKGRRGLPQGATR